MRAVEASEVNERNQGTAEPGTASIELYERADTPLGWRLAQAREQHGWSASDVAARLKLPVKLIARLESDDYAGLTEGVFLRGYLGSYARLVGVPVEQAASVAAAHTQVAPLVATGTISRSRYLFERYSVSATYLVLTAIIVVPAVWLATHGGLEQNLARTTLLDPPASIAAAPGNDVPLTIEMQSGDVDSAESGAPAGAAVPSLASVPADQPPVIASMAPFATAPLRAPAPVAAAPAPETAAVSTAAIGSGAHTLDLKLSQQSWVEIVTADGRKLEYGMLAAGSEHSYRSDAALSVRLGNAQGAEVRSDGNVIDLGPFQRGNVAHVKVFGGSGSGVSRVDQ